MGRKSKAAGELGSQGYDVERTASSVGREDGCGVEQDDRHLVEIVEATDDYLCISRERDAVQAHDVQGQGHRARAWRGTPAYIGANSPIEVVRNVQKTWAELNPEQLVKWSFPTKRRDCLRIKFREIGKMENLIAGDVRSAFFEIARGRPDSVVRSISYLYLNYLHPYHTRIQAHGRHLLMLKVYEGKDEAHCWHIPLKEVRELHMKTADSTSGGMSLNDVQLVETYAVENTFCLHAETFAPCNPGQHGSVYGTRTWVGGMALHLIREEREVMDKSQEFAMVRNADLADLSEKRAKQREKRTRKKASQQLKKTELAIVQAAEDLQLKAQMESTAAARRKEGLVQPHASLNRLFRSDTAERAESESAESTGSD